MHLEHRSPGERLWDEDYVFQLQGFGGGPKQTFPKKGDHYITPGCATPSRNNGIR
jgi:hypothetical protein